MLSYKSFYRPGPRSGTIDPLKLLARLQTRLWSESIGFAFSGADQIVGNTFDVLPKETRAHIHSSAAWRLFQLNDPKTHNLQDWSEILNKKL